MVHMLQKTTGRKKHCVRIYDKGSNLIDHCLSEDLDLMQHQTQWHEKPKVNMIDSICIAVLLLQDKHPIFLPTFQP